MASEPIGMESDRTLYLRVVPNAKGDLLSILYPYEGDMIHIIPQYPVHSKKELMDFLEEVEEKGAKERWCETRGLNMSKYRSDYL